MKLSPFLKTTFVIIAFLVANYGRKSLEGYTGFSFSSPWIRIAYNYAWWIIPALITMGYLVGFRNIIAELGLKKGFAAGLSFAFATVLPMLISSAFIGKIDSSLSFGSLMQSTLLAGFMEELFFRGFLFGMLFRRCGWGFIPAAVFGGVVFGMGHIYQGNTLIETMGVFMITAVGAAWFSWLYIEWKENLWVPIFLHIFMNLSWALFDISNNALGDIYANIFRTLTIALTIIITVSRNKKHGLVIRKSNLFLNKAREDV